MPKSVPKLPETPEEPAVETPQEPEPEIVANSEPERPLGEVEADNYSRLHALPESEGIGNADANDLSER